MILDSKEPTLPLEQYAYNETRYRMLLQSNEERAETSHGVSAKHDIRNNGTIIIRLAKQAHLINATIETQERRMTMLDLTTTYLGLPLKNPLVASASPLSKKLDTVRRLEDAGAAAHRDVFPV